MKIGLRHVDDKDATFIADADMIEFSRIRQFIARLKGVSIPSRNGHFPIIAEQVVLDEGEVYIELIFGEKPS